NTKDGMPMNSTRNSPGTVLAVCLKEQPGLPKLPAEHITLVEGYGVEGDFHAGKNIRHRYLARKDPARLNNRQVLLVDSVIQGHVQRQGINLQPGELGENILLDGVDLMAVEVGTLLEIGPTLIELTEVREPCSQLDGIYPGLHRAVEIQTAAGVQPYAGMLGVILKGGEVQPGDRVHVILKQG
ncbi:MAG: MOSC domain-containing protein, partial [Anaerolineales bacterium]